VGINREKRKWIERISAGITKKGGTVDTTYIMKPGQGRKYSSRAALEGYDAVYAAGGDGTLNDVASGLVGRKTPFGIIPLGTGNGLARGLNIPFDLESLVQMFERHKVIPIDVGKIASHYFFSVAGIGYEVTIAEEFNRIAGQNRHIRTLVMLALKNYFFKRPEPLTIEVNGQTITRKVFGLTFCNTGQYGSGAVIAPQASARDGKLTAAVIPKLNPIAGVQAAFRLFNNTIHELKALEYIDFTTMKVKREKPGSYEVDGETHAGGTTFNVSVLPAALRVIVP
jgi:YegS/Rv2252/BmrU family lipid kinase